LFSQQKTNSGGMPWTSMVTTNRFYD